MSQRLPLSACLALLVAAPGLQAGDSPSVLLHRGSLPTAAARAIDDLLHHWWEGPAATGHITRVFAGKPNPRDMLWERGMMYFVLYDAWRFTGDETLRARLVADWNETSSRYSPTTLEALGDKTFNYACDDAGWSAMMYVMAYRASGDPAALARARGLIRNVNARWLDDQCGGGLWYNDAHDEKSLYQAAITLAALWVYELTADPYFLETAQHSYDWMESRLLRPDGLYWEGCTPSGPLGRDHPDDIREAGSPVFLGGNMAMGVLHAKFYRLTGKALYLQRAQRTADALAQKLVTPHGTYLNDRDAWTNGAFVGEWVTEVLTLPGFAPRHAHILATTAASIAANARTPDGHYGGSWDGPAEGDGSRWWQGKSIPQQLMTSATSAHLIVATAALVFLADRPTSPPAQ